jgi:pimeloyl-ACP methyl ester carboxylesterase
MAQVDRGNGASIHWQATGKGQPLALVMGLGCSSAMWFRLSPRLAKRYRVIVLDNRGVGRTKADADIHTIPEMAHDLAAVLDAAGEDSAHVFGFSMGGMIAQEFALHYPNRVRSLILGGTSCGGLRAVKAQASVLELLFSRVDMTPQQSLEVMVPYIYDAATPRSMIEQDLGVRLADYPSPRGYIAQLKGLSQWASYPRLGNVRAPTLVLHGVSDRLIPPQNAHILADAIGGARLELLEQASHMFQTDRPQATEAMLEDFLGHVERNGATS